MVKKFAVLIASVCASLLLTAAVVAATSYQRAPAAVARLGALPFSPDSLPRSRLCALLAVQDPTFYEHHGIGLTGGSPGHTTITQAIGKFLFFDDFSPGFLHYRKAELMVAAWSLDRRLSKEQQLRIFLNRIYLGRKDGRDVLGFPAAARAYYGKSLTRLSDQEYFGLLAMLESPNTYNVLRAPALNRERAGAMERRARERCDTARAAAAS